MELSESLKAHRIKNNFSQNEIANKLSISRQAISKWENGHTYPDIDNLKLLTKIYQISMDDLMNGPTNILETQIDITIKDSTQKREDVDILPKKTKIEFQNETNTISKDSSNDIAHKDSSVLLLLVAIIGALIPFIGIALIIYTIKMNQKNNIAYKLIGVIAVLCLLLNLNNSILIINDLFTKNGVTTIEKID